MENVIHRLTLDLAGPDTIPRVEVQQDNARTLVISLTQGGRPYWIAEGVTAVFSARKPDGNPLFNACTVEKNRVRYDFTEQTTNVAGIVECEILLYSGDERILASPRFELAIDELIHRDGDVPESAPEIGVLDQMIARGTAMLEDLQAALEELGGLDDLLAQVRALAEAASNSEAAARGHAKTAADAAADALGSAGRAYESEQNAVTAWGDARVQAETAQGYAIRAEAAAERAEAAANGSQGGGNESGQNHVQSDLSQNDPTRPDYVKHRTHYEENNQTVIEWDGNTEGRDSFEFSVATFYKVSDLVPQEDTVVGGTLAFSSGESMSVGTDTIVAGEGGYIIFEPAIVMKSTKATIADIPIEAPSTGIYFVSYGASEYTSSLTYGSTIVHPLDEKWIPDSIARKTDIGQNMVQSDLSQNDPEALDYVKHRTHWEEGNQTVIEWDGNTEGRDSLEIDGFMFYKVSDLLPTEEGITGGELVFSTGESMPVATESIAVGDGCFLVAELVIVMQNTHATVAGFSLEAPSTGVYFASVSADTYAAFLTYGSTLVHPLDEKFIPASIARKTDIPTDDHINNLINTALGVIENGTY